MAERDSTPSTPPHHEWTPVPEAPGWPRFVHCVRCTGHGVVDAEGADVVAVGDCVDPEPDSRQEEGEHALFLTETQARILNALHASARAQPAAAMQEARDPACYHESERLRRKLQEFMDQFEPRAT